MAELTNPHDSFFKEFFSRPDLAADFLANYLPPPVAALLDLDAASIELAKDSFIDLDLRPHYSDLLYRVRLRDGRPAFVFILLEHKSYRDGLVPLQLLGYMVQIWQRELRRDRRAPLVPIIPIVVYHGRTSWEVAPGFGSLFEGPEALRRYWPDFEYGLTDLSLRGQAEIRGQPQLRLVALIMRYAHDPGAKGRLPELMAVWLDLPDPEMAVTVLAAIGRYLSQVVPGLREENVHEAAKVALSDTGGEQMTTFIETWVEESRQQGLLQGMQEGIRTGLLDGIELALDLKFGAAGLALMPELRAIADVDTLRAAHAAIRTAREPEDVRAVYA